MALRGHNEMEGNLMQLLLLRSDDHPGLKNFMSDKRYLSPEVINELVSLMGRYVLKRYSRVFSQV